MVANAVCTIGCNGRRFYIMRHNGGFVAVETIYVKHGVVTEDLSPDITLWHEDMRDTISAVIRKCKFAHYWRSGLTLDAAAIRAIREVGS